MPELKTVLLTSIDHNPHRDTTKYPFDKAKLTALERSMRDVGCWEGIIVRKAGRRYQAAFGHHRLEAAAMADLTRVPVIVKDLDDDDMLRYMGRENGEDYRATFLVLLETWNAAAQHGSNLLDPAKKPIQDIDVARFLGWTRTRPGRKSDVLTPAASACGAAANLIKGKYLSRTDLWGLSVRDAQHLCERAQARMNQADAAVKQGRVSRESADTAKAMVGKGVRRAAEIARSAEPGRRAELRGSVDNETTASTREERKTAPVFEVFADSLCGQLDRLMNTDAYADKLREIEGLLDSIHTQPGREALEKIRFDLGRVSSRAANWQTRLIPNKVAPKLVPKNKRIGEDK